MRDPLGECQSLAMTACTRNRPRWHASPRSQADVTETFSLALTCHFASIFPRVFKHAACSKFPMFFQVARSVYRETGCVMFSHCVPRRCPTVLRLSTLCQPVLCSALSDLRFESVTTSFGSSPIKKITHFHGTGASRFNEKDLFLCVAMSVEQAHQRSGIAEE